MRRVIFFIVILSLGSLIITLMLTTYTRIAQAQGGLETWQQFSFCMGARMPSSARALFDMGHADEGIRAPIQVSFTQAPK